MNKRLVYTKLVYDYTGELVELCAHLYSGAVALCGGPSRQMEDIGEGQQAFYNTVMKDYNTTFAGQQNILSSLQSSFQPILQAGINQYGFSKPEDAALRSQATQSTAAQYNNAARATNEALAARGGSAFVPSGVNSQLQAQTAQAAAGQESAQQLGITEGGYSQGRQNYLSAANALGGVASQMNPTGYGGIANNAGQAAFSSADKNQELKTAQWTQLAGALGGIATGIATGGASTALGAFSGGSIGGVLDPALGSISSMPLQTGGADSGASAPAWNPAWLG